jgi:hypothetical protein
MPVSSRCVQCRLGFVRRSTQWVVHADRGRRPSHAWPRSLSTSASLFDAHQPAARFKRADGDFRMSRNRDEKKSSNIARVRGVLAPNRAAIRFALHTSFT